MTMSDVAAQNVGFVECWNEILTPKWIRFRHLLSGNGKLHSDVAMPRFGIRPGQRVLDFGCGFGETTLELGRLVGPGGSVLGLDCTSAFLEIANRERDQTGVTNVRYELGDAQVHPFAPASFDVAYARFGVMFFESAVRALRNVHRALVPGGAVCLIVWRGLADNPAWGAARDVVRRYLPPPGEGAATCGPGPFSWADEETDRSMLAAAGFTDIDLFERNDLPMCVGRSLQEAIDYQMLVGPSGEIVREAGLQGTLCLPEIRAELAELFRPNLRPGGVGVYMGSSTWFIRARKSNR
ncbi:MAG TPA: class I SAM-dependent methyltransferase [Polyangia bacterium]|nr:class I SAM-dependent methyltransferase [Polyangia bacterium]